MHKSLLLSAVILATALSVSAQSIKGKIKLNDQWKQAVYLLEMSRYDDPFIERAGAAVDSFFLSNEGYFYFDHLKPNTLYRLNVIPNDGFNKETIIQDGTTDNYSFFVTSNSKAQLYFTSNIAELYRSGITISSNNELNLLQKQIAVIDKNKKPVYDLLAKLGREMDKMQADSLKADAFRQQAVMQIQKALQESNRTLMQYLQQVQNPEVLAYGLSFFIPEANIDTKEMAHQIQKLKHYPSHPLAVSMEQYMAGRISTISPDFLTRTYTLLNGGSIKLDTISSRFILLDLWASWCSPCRQSIRGDLKTLRAEFNKEQLTIIGINTQDKKQNALQAIVQDRNTNMQILDEAKNGLYDYFKASHLPYYILIDKEKQTVKEVPQVATLGEELKELQ